MIGNVLYKPHLVDMKFLQVLKLNTDVLTVQNVFFALIMMFRT